MQTFQRYVHRRHLQDEVARTAEALIKNYNAFTIAALREAVGNLRAEKARD